VFRKIIAVVLIVALVAGCAKDKHPDLPVPAQNCEVVNADYANVGVLGQM